MFRFPFGTVQELNLDWFLEQWEIFKVQAREAFEGIDHALDDEIDRVEDAMTDLYAARDAAIAAKTAAETAESSTLGYAQSAANSAASAAGSAAGSATSASSSAGSAEQAAQSAQTSAQQASSAATSAGNAATSATNASSSAATAANNAGIAGNYSQESAAWATGSYTGDPSQYPVPSTAPQHENNAKYYAESISGDAASAAASASDAADSATAAAASAASISTSAAQIAQNASDIVDLRTDLTAAEDAITDLQTDLDAAESDITDLQTNISTAESNITDLQTDLSTAESNITNLQTDLDAAESDISDLQTDLDAVENDIGDLNADVLAAYPQATLTDQSIASFSDGADNIPIKELTVHVEPVQAGNGDPSPENVRPISGHTGCKVTRTGKNLLSVSTVNLGGTNPRTANRTLDTVIPAGTYYFSCQKSGTSVSGYGIDFFNSNNQKIGALGYATIDNGDTITLSDNAVRIYAYMPQEDYTDGKTLDIANMQLEIGTTATAFEEYEGTTYDVDFPVEAGTVYGANLTVHQDGSGTLVVNMANVDAGSLNYTAYGSTAQYDRYISSGIDTSAKDNGTVICDKFASKVRNQQAVPNQVWISGGASKLSFSTNPGAYESPAAFKTAVSGVQLVYELANPITYTLTPEQVGVITTLYGNNNIWSDCGNIDLTYRTWNNPDVKLRLTKAIIAPVLDSMTADTALSANDFRIVGDTLYKITASVASGGTLTPGTNCTATTVCTEITSILNS